MTKSVFDRFLYGGDYNPNQWEREVWSEDIELFKESNLNSATINVFSWAKIQPSEEEYDFSELDEIIAMLTKEDYDIVLGTATAALPAWMFKKYPEVGRTDFQGRQHRFGQRHNACPNSLIYQKYARKIAEKLAERYGDNEKVVCWHVNNEYGGECFCENCEKQFRVWLKNKYKTIEALNKAWNMHFWGHTVYEWDEIVVPNELSEGIDYDNTAFSGISIDYRRFNSDGMLENFKMERDAIRIHDQETPITTNMMGTYKLLDYFKWAKEMDIVSWDNYPAFDTPWSKVAMDHDLMRSLKNQPFMLMEQTPSQQNWQPYNSLKKPGQMRAQSYQTMAHGADTIQFFQLRRTIGACEKFHGAVIAHVGTNDTRVFREITQLGAELKQLDKNILGSDNPTKVGIMFDWDNYWALEYTSGPNKDLKYIDQIHQYYRYFYDQNIPVEFVPMDRDLSKFDLIVAPVLYMVKEGVQERLTEFVKKGGTFVTGFMSGIVDESDNVHLGGYPGPLREMAGIWVEEIDALAPGQSNTIQFRDGEKGVSTLLADVIHLEKAESIADYSSNFYTETPVITKNKYGNGQTFYIGTELNPESLDKVLDMAVESAKVTPILEEKTKLEVITRTNNGSEFYFILNFTEEELALPSTFIGSTDLLTNEKLKEKTILKQHDVHIIKKDTK